MKRCGVDEIELGAFIDNELDAMGVRRMESHIATCADCAAAASSARAIRALLTEPNVAYPAPPELRAEIAKLLTQPKPAGAASIRRPIAKPWRESWRTFWGGWSAGLATAASAAAIMFFLIPTGKDDAASRDLVADHVRSLMAEHLTDVTTSDRHTVKPWFAGKTAFSPPVVDLAADGFPLVGGRLDYASGHPVAALIYRRQLHVINVFIWAPSPNEKPSASGASSKDGFNLLRWEAAGLNFVAVSDLNTQELGELRDKLLQPAPP